MDKWHHRTGSSSKLVITSTIQNCMGWTYSITIYLLLSHLTVKINHVCDRK